jgi:hypothetical protein
MPATQTKTILTVDGIRSPMLKAGPAEATAAGPPGPGHLGPARPVPAGRAGQDRGPLDLGVYRRPGRAREDRLRAGPLVHAHGRLAGPATGAHGSRAITGARSRRPEKRSKAMRRQPMVQGRSGEATDEARERVLAGVALTQRRLRLASVDTVVLEGGSSAGGQSRQPTSRGSASRPRSSGGARTG